MAAKKKAPPLSEEELDIQNSIKQLHKSRKKAAKRAARTPPFVAYPEWSEAKFWGFLRSALRSAYNKWPPKWKVLHAAKREYKGKLKNQKWEYRCALCKRWYKSREVSVDHIIPAGSLNKWEDLAPFAERLFCSEENLQVLCKTCHDAKSLEERNKKKETK